MSHKINRSNRIERSGCEVIVHQKWIRVEVHALAVKVIGDHFWWQWSKAFHVVEFWL